MILVSILIIFEETESEAFLVRTSNELIRTLHHSPIQRQRYRFKSAWIQNLEQLFNGVLLFAVLCATIKLEYVDVLPNFGHME